MVAHVKVVGAVRLVEGDDHRGQPLVDRSAVVGGQGAGRPGLCGADGRRGRDLVECGVLPHVQVVGAVGLVVALHHGLHPAVGARLVAAAQAAAQLATARRGGAPPPLAHGDRAPSPYAALNGGRFGIPVALQLQLQLLLLHALQLLLLLDELLVLHLQLLGPLLLQPLLLHFQPRLLLHQLLLTAPAVLELCLQALVLLLQPLRLLRSPGAPAIGRRGAAALRHAIQGHGPATWRGRARTGVCRRRTRGTLCGALRRGDRRPWAHALGPVTVLQAEVQPGAGRGLLGGDAPLGVGLNHALAEPPCFLGEPQRSRAEAEEAIVASAIPEVELAAEQQRFVQVPAVIEEWMPATKHHHEHGDASGPNVHGKTVAGAALGEIMLLWGHEGRRAALLLQQLAAGEVDG
mmetsp:Transcript_89051/g.236551  ORF Transcript_89051/g.236551 Transcript_89051/m.236551 type:complete len:405 (+) Transcript_89051:862-2076(+)